MFDIKEGKLIKYLGNDKVVYIPDDVITILDGAFENSDVEEVYGNNVIEFCLNAFVNCNNLKKIFFYRLNKINEKNVTYKENDTLLHTINEISLSVDAEIVEKTPSVALKSARKNEFKIYKNASSLLDGIIKMEKTIDLIPSATRDLRFKMGYKTYLVDSQIYTQDEIIDAFAVEEDKVMIVDKECIEEALLHEYGHALDYIFNCSGVITNMTIKGIPIMDTFCAFVYPWFMCLLFVISGIYPLCLIFE